MSFPEKNIYILITEFTDYISLENLLILQKMDTNEQEIFSRRLFDTIAYMHGENILHRDLNVENLLVCPKTFDFKIIDFGLAVDLKESEWVLNDEGNVKYRIKDSDYVIDNPLSIDYWSLLLIVLSLESQEIVSTRDAKQLIKDKDSHLMKSSYFSMALKRCEVLI